ncbi:hypothetical protein [Desertivirga arenae]|uniref:hypothetical protein n=1 Tax=Desertivirga arenae TaxID=2810309 RepID=UPI001A9567C2|nr:hypothetical protein [Pedobacter sp. SYSU D00823]
MKYYKLVLTGGILIITAFFMGSFFIAKNFFIQRSVFIEASDTAAFDYASNYKHFNSWNPFYEKEPKARYKISGSPGTAGYSFSWHGEEVGSGKFEFVGNERYKAIYQKLTYERPFEGSFLNYMYFTKTYKGIIVTWAFCGENKTTLDKWKSLFYDQMVGEDYQMGLNKLKEELEKQTLTSSKLQTKTASSL